MQLAEPSCDEFLRVERHRITWTTLSQACIPQHGDGRWIEAEEMKTPPIRPVTFQVIEEGKVAIVQQALPQVLSIAAQDQILPLEGNL